MKKENTKAAFKLNAFGFKLDTTIGELSFPQLIIVIVLSMIFILELIMLQREYAVFGISLSTILHKISNLEVLQFIKARFS